MVRSIAAALVVVGCGAPGLTPAGSAVKVMKADPPTGCTEVGTVEGSETQIGGDADGARVELRNEAGEKGANYVRLDTADRGGRVITGTAYKCP